VYTPCEPTLRLSLSSTNAGAELLHQYSSSPTTSFSTDTLNKRRTGLELDKTTILRRWLQQQLASLVISSAKLLLSLRA